MVNISERFHYKTLSKFMENYYDGLITESMACGDRMYLEKVKYDGEEMKLEDFFFPYRVGKDVVLLPHEFVEHLPVKVTEHKFVAYNKSGYILAENCTKMKITEEEAIPYHEIVDQFAPFESTSPDEDDILRLIAIVSYIDRINVAIAGRKASGKTSRFEILRNLTGNVASIAKPTFAKLKYLLGMRTLVINEVNGLSRISREDLETFFLDAGDGKEWFENNSRASKGVVEKFNISKLSIVLLFNTYKEMGYRPKKFFHYMWDNEAVPDRFFPIEIQSSIKTKFTSVFNVDNAANNNREFYINLVKTIRKLRNDRPDIRFKLNAEYEFEKNRDRWEANFRTLVYWCDIFSKSEEQFNARVKTLYKCHQRYILSLEGVEFKPEIDLSSELEENKEVIKQIKLEW